MTINNPGDSFELQSISLESRTTPEEDDNEDDNDNDLVLHELDYEESPATDHDDTGKSSMKMAFMNMSNSILGAGIIGQPYATKNCGIFTSLITFVLLTVIIDWTIRLIIINCKLSATKTYQDTAYKCFGKPGKIVILISQGFFAIGGSIAFCIIIGDTIPHVLQSITPSSWIENNALLALILKRNTVIVLLTCFISYPLSLTDNIANLAVSSLFALINMATIILIIVIHGFTLSKETVSRYTFENPFQGYVFNPQLFQGISVISFALVCHHNTSFIYDSLRKPTLDRFTKLTHLSCFISMICCALVGVSGDLIFKDNTKGNILNNFPEDDWVINIARVCFGLNMLTTFPLEIFVVRQVMNDLININKNPEKIAHQPLSQTDNDFDQVDDLEEPKGEEMSYNKRFWITTLLVFVTMGASLLTCNLGATLELIGSVSASIMAFIFPVMCYMKLTDYKSKTLKENLCGYFVIVFGVLILVISSAQTIVQAINEKGGGDHCKVG
ncbi:Avt2 protein [Saccharomycopsis crataegensis]|uniref:Avt2 protein n=1 Tax=Saccharomycopsis crataegensis TaxID=43959 RepID=A0AAV5QTZ8_9ASCO|nr:Avt2 protein [Saccharomycopsis crataegensis]